MNILKTINLKQINKNMCKKEENCTFHLQMKNSWHHLRIERGASSFSCTKHYLKATSSLTRDNQKFQNWIKGGSEKDRT